MLVDEMDETVETKRSPEMHEQMMTWTQRALHVGLVLVSAYIAANPEYAWALPALQAIGQGIPQPR